MPANTSQGEDLSPGRLGRPTEPRVWTARCCSSALPRAPALCHLHLRALLRPVLRRARAFCSSICPQDIRELLEMFPLQRVPARSILPQWGTAHELLFLVLSPNSSRQGSWNICSELHRSLQLICSPAVPGRVENFNPKDDLLLFLQQQKLLPDPKVRWIPQPMQSQPEAHPAATSSQELWEKRGTE